MSAGIMNGRSDAGITAMVIDGDELMRDVIELYLTAAGVQCLTAHSPDVALSVVKQESIDLIFMDLQLGDESGQVLTRCLRSMDIPQPVIIGMSGDTSVDERRKALASGMDEFLDKPIHAEDIELMVCRFFSETDRPTQDRQHPRRGARSNAGSLPQFLDTDRAHTLHKHSGHLAGYLASYASSCAYIKHHIWVARQQKNLVKVGQLIHRLHGAAASLGDVSIQTLSEQIRHQLNGRSDISVQRSLLRLEHILIGRIDDIHRYLNSQKKSEASGEAGTEHINDVTRRLQETLRRHRIPESSDVNEIIQFLRGNGQTTAANSLKLAVDQYDFPQAERVLSVAMRSA